MNIAIFYSFHSNHLESVYANGLFSFDHFYQEDYAINLLKSLGDTYQKHYVFRSKRKENLDPFIKHGIHHYGLHANRFESLSLLSNYLTLVSILKKTSSSDRLYLLYHSGTLPKWVLQRLSKRFGQLTLVALHLSTSIAKKNLKFNYRLFPDLKHLVDDSRQIPSFETIEGKTLHYTPMDITPQTISKEKLPYIFAIFKGKSQDALYSLFESFLNLNTSNLKLILLAEDYRSLTLDPYIKHPLITVLENMNYQDYYNYMYHARYNILHIGDEDHSSSSVFKKILHDLILSGIPLISTPNTLDEVDFDTSIYWIEKNSKPSIRQKFLSLLNEDYALILLKALDAKNILLKKHHYIDDKKRFIQFLKK
jgi:hypothetical protein